MGIREKRGREFKVNGVLSINPVVLIMTMAFLWGFMIWMFARPSECMSIMWWWKRRITTAFLWLYYATENVWLAFLGWLYFSKLSRTILGSKDDSTPEFSDASWAIMMFTTGSGIALFYLGVAEPIYHQQNSLAAMQKGQTMSYNAASQEAMMLSFFHFGLHGWVPYVLVGLTLGWAVHCKGLPFAMRSVFYPIFGVRIYGWIGDLIDFASAVTAFIGCATALGFADIFLLTGINHLTPSLGYLSGNVGSKTQNTDGLIAIVWVASALAVVPALLGVNWGIRRFSELGFIYSMFVAFMVFFMEDSWYLTNLLTQTVGYYLFYLVRLGHHVDAFEQLDPGIDSAAQLSPWFAGWAGSGWYQAGLHYSDGGASQQGLRSIYWGWWMCLAPLTGMWIARISKGRSVKDVIHWGFAGPALLCFIWLSVFGGAGIRMERQVILNGCRCGCGLLSNDLLPFANDSAYCTNIRANTNGITAAALYYQDTPRGGEPSPFARTCVVPVINYNPPGGNGTLLVRQCPTLVQLSTRRPEQRWFDLLDQYMVGDSTVDSAGARNLGPLLAGVSLTAVVVWFMACAAAGGYVITALLAGDARRDCPNYPVLVLVILMQAALVTAMLRAGSGFPMYDGATALQTLSVIFGMLFTLPLAALPVCLYEGLADVADDSLDTRPKWNLPLTGGVGDTLEFALSLGAHPPPLSSEWVRFVLALLVPWYVLPVAYSRIDVQPPIPGLSWAPLLFVWTFFTFWVFVCLHIVEGVSYMFNAVWINGNEGMFAIAWTAYIAFAATVAGCRYGVRQIYQISGNAVEDFFCSLLFYPLVISQISAQEVLVQAFEPADASPGPDPGLDPNLAYDSEKLSARDLYPFSPGPAEPTAYPQTMPGPTYSARPAYPGDPGYGLASPSQPLPPPDVGRPAPLPLTSQGAATYAGAPGAGPYGSNWRSAGSGPGAGPMGQAQGGNPQGFAGGYAGGYPQAPPPDAYFPWSSTPGALPPQPPGGGYDSARNADGPRYAGYPQDAYQGVA